MPARRGTPERVWPHYPLRHGHDVCGRVVDVSGDRPDLAEIARSWTEELGDVPTESFLIAATLQRLSLYVEREFTALARARDVGPGDLRILLVLARTSPGHALAPKDLFRQLLITSGAVSKQVDRLVERGLVRRIADPDELRGVLVELQPAGRQLADDAMRSLVTSFCGLETLSATESQQVYRTLDRLRAHVEQALS